MEIKRNPEKLAKVIILFIILILAAKEIYYSQKYSDQLSEIADPFSEANALRAGEGYFNDGFLSNAGLPDVLYGSQFPDTGFKEYIKNKESLIYTHYPQGPDWLAGIYTNICGVGNIGCFRIFPVLLGIISLAVFARILISALGAVKAAVLMTAVAFIPMSTNMMHGLHYQGYAFSLLLIQLAILISLFKTKGGSGKLKLSILFFLGFFQGWLSFDYFFLVCLCSLPLGLLYFRPGERDYWKIFFLALAAPTAGFCFAHLLHFLEVSLYYGSIPAAFSDMIVEANKYQVSEAAHPKFIDVAGGPGADFITSRIILLLKYLSVYSRRSIFFIINFPVFLMMVFILLWIKDARLAINKPLQVVLKWSSSVNNYYVVLSALLVSSLWIVIMKSHSVIHTHFLPRHLFLLYFTGLLTLLECVSPDSTDEKEGH
ncbi:MAG: hypothetical protein HY808_01210 [Nitrospirae bacterium]|nr:hypothetical protein [Nitrospirota bacterium]